MIKKHYSFVIDPEMISSVNKLAEKLSKKRKKFLEKNKLNINEVEGKLQRITSSAIIRQGIMLMLHLDQQGMFDEQDYEIVLRDSFYL